MAFTSDERQEARQMVFELYKLLVIGTVLDEGGPTEENLAQTFDTAVLAAKVFKEKDASEGAYDSIDLTP